MEDTDIGLTALGWDDRWAAAFAGHAAAGRFPARVSRTDRGACTVLAPQRLRVPTEAHPVVTGDWVALDHVDHLDHPDEEPGAAIAAILPRRNALSRRRVGTETEQIVAANVDVALLVNSLDTPLDTRRLERYLAMAGHSGVTAVVVLTKVDLCPAEQVAETVTAARAVAIDVDVRPVSATTGTGLTDLVASYLRPGTTVALLGASGVGKSTLVNALAGSEIMKTGTARADGTGRHTTTHRELVQIPGAGLLLDMPGMQSLALWNGGGDLGPAFADIEELAQRCRFSDCRHDREPDCAVLAAVASGALPAARLASWRALQAELHPSGPGHLEPHAQRWRRDLQAEHEDRTPDQP